MQIAQPFLKGDSPQVKHMDPVTEMLESEHGSGASQRGDRFAARSRAVLGLVLRRIRIVVEGCGIASREAGISRELLDRCPGQQYSEAQASPLPGEPHRVEYENPATKHF